MAEALFVVVSGPPASGKSTLAPLLAAELALPLIAKDTIKDALMSLLPVQDVEASRQLGRAAVTAMLAVAAESPVGAVLESNFYDPSPLRTCVTCPVGSLRSSVAATPRSQRNATGLAPVLAWLATSIRCGPWRNCGTTRWPSQWLADGRCSRSTRTVPST